MRIYRNETKDGGRRVLRVIEVGFDVSLDTESIISERLFFPSSLLTGKKETWCVLRIAVNRALNGEAALLHDDDVKCSVCHSGQSANAACSFTPPMPPAPTLKIFCAYFSRFISYLPISSNVRTSLTDTGREIVAGIKIVSKVTFFGRRQVKRWTSSINHSTKALLLLARRGLQLNTSATGSHVDSGRVIRAELAATSRRTNTNFLVGSMSVRGTERAAGGVSRMIVGHFYRSSATWSRRNCAQSNDWRV